MSELYTIGLQAGKNVVKAVEDFIELQYCDESRNFNPKKRKDLEDGTSIYEWYMKWAPSWFREQGEFISLLKRFNGSSDEDDAYKLVCVGNEGGHDEFCNDIGYDILDLYYNLEIAYPEDWEEDEINNELPANIIDIFEDFLDERNVEIDNDEHQGDEGEAIIYGSDFDFLMEKITETLRNHGINVKDSWS